MPSSGANSKRLVGAFMHSAIRILHVVGAMERGGVETWLLHVLRNTDRERFHMDFLVHTTSAAAYDNEIRALGSKILPCISPSHPVHYAREFYRIIDESGPYDAVHSHVHYFSGYVLRLAERAGISMRIAHSHSDTVHDWSNPTIMRRAYLITMRSWINRAATHGLAASAKAAISLFGPQWNSDCRWRVLHCGIDLEPFAKRVDKLSIRRDLGISSDARVVGHVGSFKVAKNHRFLLDIAQEVLKIDPRIMFLLVGDGSLRPVVEAEAARRGLCHNMVFAGKRADVADLMLGAMDVFVLPSLYEGLPLALLEAQAAGLRCVVSSAVTDEADVVDNLVRRLAITDSASIWAEELIDAMAGVRTGRDNSVALAALEGSTFTGRASAKQLELLYQECRQQTS